MLLSYFGAKIKYVYQLDFFLQLLKLNIWIATTSGLMHMKFVKSGLRVQIGNANYMEKMLMFVLADKCPKHVGATRCEGENDARLF